MYLVLLCSAGYSKQPVSILTTRLNLVVIFKLHRSFIRDEQMSEDFLRLVSQANPATRQYQPTHNGYPPSTGPYLDSPQQMDPFFDDDDENLPDSVFDRPAPMQSQESGLHLTRAAAPPAGSSSSNQGFGDGVPQGWNFEIGRASCRERV